MPSLLPITNENMFQERLQGVDQTKSGGDFARREEPGLPPGGLARENRLDGRRHGGQAWGG